MEEENTVKTTPTIVIYSTPTCHFCDAAKTFLTDHNIPYTNHDVSEDATLREEMIAMTGQMGVPVIKIDEEIMVGYDEEKMKELVGI